MKNSQANTDYQRIANAIHFLQTQQPQQPSLEQLAAHLHLSRSHCQRLFQRWAGISPKQFLQFLSKEHALNALRNNKNILDSTLDSGLSSPGRLHDLVIHWQAMTPGAYRKLGEGLDIEYGVHATPFGQAAIATTEKGICHLSFLADEANLEKEKEKESLQQRFPRANWIDSKSKTKNVIDAIFHSKETCQLPLHVWGTPFQHKVWEALIKIPEGQLCSYGDVAKTIGKPKASRAVGTAIGQNNLAVLIPCHRVIRQTGEMGGYRWGVERKQALQIKEIT